jgi:hypothetical protein
MTTFEVKRFDMASMKPSRCSMVVGKKGMGKSVMIENIMYHIKDAVDLGLAISPTEDSQKMFESHLGYTLVWTEFDVDRIQAIIEEQRHNRGALDRPFKVVIFMDDMGFDEKLWKNKTMLDLHFNQRHIDIQVVFSVQYVLSIKPDVRSNIDYVFAFNEKIGKNRQKLYEHFFGVFTNFSSFDKTMRACTQDYECIVLDNTQNSNNLDDTVFYFRANASLPPFKLGAPAFHALDKHCRKKGAKKRPVIPALAKPGAPDAAADPDKITTVVKAKAKRPRKPRGPAVEPLVLDAL